MQQPGAGGTVDTGDLQGNWLWGYGYGERGRGRAGAAAQRPRSEEPCGCSAVRPGPPATGVGTSGDPGRGRAQPGAGGKQSGGTVPTQPRSRHPLPSTSAPRARTPETVNLLPTGRGTSKPGHFNIGAAREREGRLETPGHSEPLTGRRFWLRRGTGRRAGGRPGARAHRARRLHGPQRLRAQEAAGEKKKKEEKSRLRSCWCCRRSRRAGEGRARPGGPRPPGGAERARRGLRKGGGGFLPPAGPACSKRQHPRGMHMALKQV